MSTSPATNRPALSGNLANKSAAELLATPVQFLKGVGPDRAKLMERLGLRTAADVLFNFPRDYQDLTDLRSIEQLEEDKLQSVRGSGGGNRTAQHRHGAVDGGGARAMRAAVPAGGVVQHAVHGRQVSPGAGSAALGQAAAEGAAVGNGPSARAVDRCGRRRCAERRIVAGVCADRRG